MLLALLVWAYTLFLCWVYGALFFKRLSFALTVIAGLAALTIFAEFSSLFFPLSWQIHLGLLAGALYLLITRRVPLPKIQRPVSWLPFLVLILSLFLILENATQRPTNPDTNLYHAQAIRWIETYPAVPGLGNLHGRLAFNSAWLVTNALFSFSFFGLGSLHLSASVLFLMFALLASQGLSDLHAGRYTASALLRVAFLPLGIYVFGGELSSPGTDLPAGLLTWLLALLWVEMLERKQAYDLTLPVFLAVFAVTIKLSALPLLLLILPFLLTKQWRLLAQATAFGALALLPFLARNLILSGYIIYPYPALDLFNFDWKVPLAFARRDQLSVLEFGRFVGSGDASAPFSQWFPMWWARQTANRHLIFLAALATPLTALLARFSPRRYWLGWAGMYLGVLFWLFSAPDYRFGYGFLLAALMLALTFWLAALLTHFSPSSALITSFTALFVAAYLLLTLALSFDSQTFPSRILLPTDYDHVAVDNCSLANGPAFCARNYGFCAYADLPCAPAPRPWVELRGAGLREGFRATQP